MLHLYTFSRLDLRDDSGHDYSSFLVNPKRLALLVYLAAAQPYGFHRRDTLLGLLWPELEQERARASLRKAVYHIRRSLGEGVIISRGDDELAVDHSFLDCDVVRFRAALKSGDAACALDVYSGLFLDGFFVSDSAGFEDWMERERKHLHDLAFKAAWSVAAAADSNGDTFAAAHAARQAAALIPDDEASLRKLMELLDRIGDRAGALSTYEQFARRLWREYEADPSTETQSLAVLIRHRDEGVVVPLEQSRQSAKPIVRRKRRAIAGIALMAVALVAGVSGVRFMPSGVTSSARSIAVMPFSYHGPDELAYLGEGMVNLLATNLDQIGEFRTVDASAVLNRTNDLKTIDAVSGANIALQLGAGLFVMGDIVEANGKLRVSAGLYDVRGNNRARARATAEGDVAQLFEIIDGVTNQLVASDRRAPSERFTRLALLTTHSVPALKAYLQGEQQFRAGRYNESVESFQKAIEADSTFALGYYRLALAHMWGSNDSDRVAAARAIAHGHRLAGPERALLDALMPFFRGDIDEAERQYRAILVRRPEESEVWYPLGEVLFHHNPMRGRSVSDARPAFEKALTLGPKDGPLTHLVEIAGIERDYVAFDSLFTGIQPASHFYFAGQMVQAFRLNDADQRAAVIAGMRDSSDARLVTAARHAMFLLEDERHSAVMLDLLTEQSRPRNVRSWGYIHRAHLAVGGGRASGALAEFDAAWPLDRTRAILHKGWLLSLPFMNTSRARLRDMRDELAGLDLPDPPTTPEADLVLRADRESHAHIRAYLLGIISAQLGDYAAAQRAADILSKLPGTPDAKDLASDLTYAVGAEILRLQGRSREALSELERTRRQFNANRLNGPPFFSQVRERYIRAELLNALGRREEAIGWYASFDEHGPWGRAVLAQAALQQARIYEALGSKREAVRHYARFIGLYENAEPPFQPLLAQAKQRLAIMQRVN